MQIPLGQFVCKPSGAMVTALHTYKRCLFIFHFYAHSDLYINDYSPLVFRVVKLSSPYLNVLIISGVILYYIDVILFGIDANKASRCTVNVLCMVRGAKKSTLLCLCVF